MISKKLSAQLHGQVENPALLFLHAFPFTSEMWREQLKTFSEKHYCIAPDLPGFGDNPLPPNAVMFEHYVDHVLNLLKELKIQKAIWCGLSMGGYLALRMYERAPELCRGLILCDTKAGADTNEGKIKRAKAINSLVASRIDFMASQWEALVGESSKTNIPLKMEFEELVAKVNDRGISSGLVALATRTDTVASLSNVRVPTLIVVGEEDKVTPVSESEIMAKAIPGSQLKVIGKAGHLSHLENPKDFNKVLSNFLTSLS